ncbi:hypothetical protein [Chryseobacterium sp. CT-SW4]|uniref:hypothetical protein n=1 Tax=Chryseobacterium sp. SW-1 TaxID=3157343 RepID=UPI003B02ABC7
MLVCFSVISKAQQRGVGINTTSPAATLDVAANTSNNSMPDAVLVPRMTADQLIAKDNTSGTYGADQNGAIVFITSGTGNTTRTSKITGAGFYYFDSTVPEWKTIAGIAPSSNTVTNITAEQTSSYTALATDDIILLNVNSSGTTLTLPTSGISVGKKLYVTNKGNNSVDISPLPREGQNQNIPAQQGVILVYVGGTGAGSWSLISGF